MSGQYTPGPWDCTGCLFPDDDMGGVYYRVQADGIDARAANARLIAAAPELLEALIAVQEMNRKGVTGSEARKVWSQARNAIAKAKVGAA